MQQQIDAQAYQAVFVANTTGQKVLEELSARFYDIASYAREDPYHTAYNEGQRNVIRFILAKLAQLPNAGDEE